MNDSSGESSGTAPTQPKAKHSPVQLACISCRTRHLKCDARVPVCGRCQTEDHECHYVRSRRGYKGPRRVKRAQNDDFGTVPAAGERSAMNLTILDENYSQDVQTNIIGDLEQFSEKNCPLLSPNAFVSLLSLPSSSSENSSLMLSNASSSDTPASALTYHTSDSIRTTVPSLLCKTGPEAAAMGEYLVGLYYQNFHPAHPIVMPRRKFYARPAEQVPPCLELTMMVIGSHYAPDTAAFRSSAIKYITSHELPKGLCTIQVYLLLFLALHGENDQVQANQLLDKAIDVALARGLNRKTFAREHGNGEPHLEESWRRTWWELYITDAMLAAIHQRQTFRLKDVETDLDLPCEERTFNHEDSIPEPKTVMQFQERTFANKGLEFSSYAYRIDAARCLASVLELGKDLDSDDQDRIEAVDASLSSWFLHLPQSKREILDGCGDNAFDEMLFQAHMIMYSSQIYLHRPRSSLNLAPASPPPSDDFCGRVPPSATPSSSLRAHAIKSIRAANSLSSLATLTVPVTKHSPFFICATVLAAIVQIAAASIGFDAYGARHCNLLPRINLGLGVLSEVGEIWDIAKHVVGQVKMVARGLNGFGTGVGEKDIERLRFEETVDVEAFFESGDADLWMQLDDSVNDGGMDAMGIPSDWGEPLVA